MRIVAAAAALAAALCAGGCDRASQNTSVPPKATPADPTPAEQAAPSPSLAALSITELRERAAVALRERRLHSPAGDNALEVYLQARVASPEDPAIAGAIEQLLPYVLIACEQAIARADFAEAQRLLALLGRGDPNAPALARLRTTLRDAQTRAEAEAARLAESEAKRLAAERAAAVSTPAAAAPTPASPPVASGATPAVAGAGRPTVAASSALPQPAAGGNSVSAPAEPAPERTAPATVAAAAPPPAASAPQTSALPRLIRQAAPRYPLIAMNRRIEGQVEVAFTVQADGSVRDARVVRAEPAEIFDRAALAAVQAYRFAPSDRRHETRRTLNFRLDGRN